MVNKPEVAPVSPHKKIQKGRNDIGEDLRRSTDDVAQRILYLRNYATRGAVPRSPFKSVAEELIRDEELLTELWNLTPDIATLTVVIKKLEAADNSPTAIRFMKWEIEVRNLTAKKDADTTLEVNLLDALDNGLPFAGKSESRVFK